MGLLKLLEQAVDQSQNLKSLFKLVFNSFGKLKHGVHFFIEGSDPQFEAALDKIEQRLLFIDRTKGYNIKKKKDNKYTVEEDEEGGNTTALVGAAIVGAVVGAALD